MRPSSFKILIDSEPLAQEEITRVPSPRFIEKDYALPEKLVKGKDKITVKFEAAAGSEISPVVAVRILRSL
jgi:hypothetical protein